MFTGALTNTYTQLTLCMCVWEPVCVRWPLPGLKFFWGTSVTEQNIPFCHCSVLRSAFHPFFSPCLITSKLLLYSLAVLVSNQWFFFLFFFFFSFQPFKVSCLCCQRGSPVPLLFQSHFLRASTSAARTLAHFNTLKLKENFGVFTPGPYSPMCVCVCVCDWQGQFFWKLAQYWGRAMQLATEKQARTGFLGANAHH